MFSSSVEYHTGLSSRGVEDPIVRARSGSQMRLMFLQVSSLISLIRRRGGRGLRHWRGCDCSGLFLDWNGSWGGSFLLHLRLADLGFRCLERGKKEKRSEHKIS